MSIFILSGPVCPTHLLRSKGECACCGVFLCERCPPGRFCEGCQEKVQFLQGEGRTRVMAPGLCMALLGGLCFFTTPMLASGLLHGEGWRDARANPAEAWLFLAFVLLPLLSGLVMTAAGLQMARNRRYGLARTGAVVCLLPITGLVWVLTVGVGLWALAVLRRVEVRALFEAERERLEGGEPGGP